MSHTLSEADSMAFLQRVGIRVAAEVVAATPAEARSAADTIGYPVAVKLCGPTIVHKSERGLVRLGLRTGDEVEQSVRQLFELVGPDDGAVEVLVAGMVKGSRELIAGAVRDPQFGPCVMLGLGGILAEAIAAVSFRRVPLDSVDAEEMIEDLRCDRLLGAWRGEGALDRRVLVDILLGLGALAAEDGTIESIDINPLVISEGIPIAVDALVVVDA